MVKIDYVCLLVFDLPLSIHPCLTDWFMVLTLCMFTGLNSVVLQFIGDICFQRALGGKGMESNVKFLDTDWDAEANVSTLHLSYLVQLLLPVRHVGWKEENKFHERFNIPLISNIEHTCIPTGSTAEGLNIPKCIVNRSSPSKFEVFSDTDLLLVPKCFKISTKKVHEKDTGFSGYFENSDVAPGYTKVCSTDSTNKEVLTFDQEAGKCYLNSTKFLTGAYSKAKLQIEKSKDTFIQGPALSIVEKEVVEFEGKFDSNAGVSRDFVLALPCTPWPDVAEKWINRAKVSPWLQTSLVDSIVEDGCHVVGTPSKQSSNPELEWRISFSASEGRIAREAVTGHQRQCYIYLKVMRHQVLKPDPVLSSYVFKSVFFYSCETLPMSHWKDSPGNCILYMLDVLLECLKKKHVPTYFVPENNLIGHLSDVELQQAIAQVQSLRSDPFSHVLDFTDHRSFAYHSQIVPFRSMVKALLDDMKEFEVHRDRMTSIQDGFLLTAVTVCQFYLLEHFDEQYKQFELQKHQEGIQALIHVYDQWLKPSQVPIHAMVTFIASIGYAMEDRVQSRDYYEAVISLGDTYPEFLELRGNLASLYHSSAYASSETSTREKYLKKASDLFEELYTDKMACVIDYITFLVKENRFEEATSVIKEFLDNVDETTNIEYSYSENEMNIIDKNMCKHVESQGVVSGDALSFAFYYLVKCLCENQQRNRSQIAAALSQLEQHFKKTASEDSFDFYNEAKKISEQQNTTIPIIPPATTCMLMFAVVPMVITLIIKVIGRH